ncbi:hypothetical protein RSOLAG22IIIB_03258 [Rhizoctonia solani]|uniref:Transmembrane protein 135 N-terminal domain-containing protein n=1 Tax=Rhizoctonia solani TaxID=456999 RepID=A0A0K6FNR0_9AGAM|nr:hypothetical protein RSOLAG22IIIB_03258 [Rhizoctonia solani]
MSRPELRHNHSIGPLSEITPSHTPGAWTPKSIATRSFENLVALARDQELRREAKKLVWRDRGEHPTELSTIEACFNHAWKGGKRAGTLGFGIRAGVNLFLLLFRIIRTPRNLKFALIRHAVFGSDTFRFAAMMGTFVAVYKFFVNALPLIPNAKLPTILQYTAPVAQSETEAGNQSLEGPLYMKKKEKQTANEATDAKPPSKDVFVRKPVARWHALVAGALAGLTVAFETPDRRLTIAQQIFVRGLQGSYNYWSKRFGIRIPLGDVMVFSLCCGQIMIQRASQVPTACVRMNHDLTRTGKFNLDDIKELIDWKRTTPANRDRLMARLEAATKGRFGPHFAPCEAVHPWFDSCKSVPLDRFISVSSWMIPIYGALHFIPMILFKQSEFIKHPWKMLKRSAYGTARSSAFLGVFVVIYQTYFCFKHNLYLAARLKSLPHNLRFAFISRASWWLGGFLSGFSLLVEDKRRRGELAMYVLPRGLESAWGVMRRRGWVPIVPGGENLLCAVGMAMVMATYQTSPQHLSGMVRRIMYQFIGPN